MSSYTPVQDIPIKFKGNLKKVKRVSEIKAKIVAHLKTIDGLQGLKSDPQIVKFIANYIENTYKAKGPDKLELLHTVMRELFPSYSAVDQQCVKTVVDFLLANRDVRARPVKFFLGRTLRFLGGLVGYGHPV